MTCKVFPKRSFVTSSRETTAMDASNPLAADLLRSRDPLAQRLAMPSDTSAVSGVSWAAIVAGAAGAAALSLILLILGTGLGLSSVSPWSDRGASATTLGVSTILWLTLTQIAASGMGGYLAGRLRTKWAAVHSDEVYFRDTAHGFLAWAVATLATAALLTSAIGAIVSGGVQAGASVAGGAAATAAATGAAATTAPADPGASARAGGMDYAVDALFRKDAAAASGATPTSDASMAAVPASEVSRIFANSLRSGTMPADDVRYVGQLVAQRTGMPQADAEKRVSDGFARLQARTKEAEAAARDAADKARKSSAYAALWLFVSLLCGAFVASLAATFGGRRRDL
jgi:hypothetical protein